MNNQAEQDRSGRFIGNIIVYGGLTAFLIYAYLVFFQPDVADDIFGAPDRDRPRPAFIPH